MSEIPPPDASPSRTPSIALGAVVYAVLSIGLALLVLRAASMQAAVGCVGCLAILAGPFLAVWHYASTYRLTLLPGEGAGLGAVAGAAGALLSGIVSQLLTLADVLPTPDEALAAQRQQMVEQGMTPEQIASAMAMAEKFGGLSSNPILGIVLGMVFGAVLGALAGMVAAAVFKKGAPA